MSILPYLLDDFHSMRPSRIMDQHFGLGLEHDDFLLPFHVPHHGHRLRRRLPGHYYRPWNSSATKQDTGSTVSLDEDKFHVNLDVQHFGPEEISVKVTGNNTITVEGKHEEKQDDHGYISRHFVRRYVLPEGHDIEKVVSSLSSDGVLSVTAPKLGESEAGDRAIPIQQTGAPSKAVENKEAQAVEGQK